jgi:hypothetical protein
MVKWDAFAQSLFGGADQRRFARGISAPLAFTALLSNGSQLSEKY